MQIHFQLQKPEPLIALAAVLLAPVVLLVVLVALLIFVRALRIAYRSICVYRRGGIRAPQIPNNIVESTH